MLRQNGDHEVLVDLDPKRSLCLLQDQPHMYRLILPLSNVTNERSPHELITAY